MSRSAGLVYEVTLSVDRELVEEFDAWLELHVQDMLDLPGFVGATTFLSDSDTPERSGRVVQYLLDNEQSLDDYLAGPADAMRRAAVLRFGDRFSATRRILRETDSSRQETASLEACLNCGEPLQGQYCANCGQRARGRLISIWELVRDAVGDLFEIDSRLWRTLIPLMLRPGKLTHDYLIGRRARFMPPFRTYLVLSIVFFLVAFFDPRQQLGILYEPSDDTAASTEEAARTAEEIRREVLDDLAADGIIVPGRTADPSPGTQTEPPPEPRPQTNAEDEAPAQSRGPDIQVERSGGLDIDCELDDFSLSGPEWLTRRVTEERLRQICERAVADSGRSFLNQLLDNIPAALFVLLPLMALVLKMLYPLSKRYYVEHLLFVLHFHAFFFLILTLQILFSRLVALATLPEMLTNLTVFVVSLYVPVYLYKSMRRVYAQGRTITILKFFVLVMTYLIGLAFMLMFAAFYTAFSF